MFRDRKDAGERLGKALRPYAIDRPILLGLIRGGMPVAAAAARTLGAEYDGLVVRKAAPMEDREYGDGAVAPGGIEVGDAPQGEVDDARREMGRRIDAYLDGHPAPDFRDRVAILVDDGLATGVTALAAIRYARSLGAAKVVVAVPVISEKARRAVTAEADAVVFLHQPEPFSKVEDDYATFEEVADQQVRDLLERRQPNCVD